MQLTFGMFLVTSNISLHMSCAQTLETWDDTILFTTWQLQVWQEFLNLGIRIFLTVITFILMVPPGPEKR